MKLYTIGFTKKSAKEFFSLIKKNEIQLLLDVRLNNKSQLAGFTKGDDLEYFLKELCGTKYEHCKAFAPTQELLSDYRSHIVSWETYELVFNEIMENRAYYKSFLDNYGIYDRICLLCSEAEPTYCHRRLVAEKIQSINPSIMEIIHI